MNSYFSLRYLNEELNAKLGKSFFTRAVSFQKNMLFMFFETENKTLKLSFCSDPTQIALFLDERLSEKKQNAVSFFESISGSQLLITELDSSDRFIYFNFDNGKQLMFRMFGSDPNALVIYDDKIIESFKNPAKNVGQAKPVPFSIEPPSYVETKGSIHKRIFKSFPKFPRDSVRQLIEIHNLLEKEDSFVQQFFESIQLELIKNASFRILQDGSFSLIPSKFLIDEEAERFDSINDATRVSFYKDRTDLRYKKELQVLNSKLDKQAARFARILEQSENALVSLERADQYEKYGNILLANAHLKLEDVDSVTLNDLYNDGQQIEIPLKKELDIPSNAQYYFEKKKKSERSFEAATAFANLIEEDSKRVEDLKSQLLEVHSKEDWYNFKKRNEGNKLLESAGKNTEGEQPQPYKIFHFGKYEIWVGKNAKSNDEVLRQSHKEDIWLHTRGVSGSHVVIRMNKAAHDPDLSVLELAASWAAWNSKAKGMELVSVIWTRRKFVRKPKGAAAGAAKVDKENTILVPPIEPENKYYI